MNTYFGLVDTTNTWASLQTFSVGLTVTASGLTVSSGGITVTGNSTITGTLGSITTLTATTGAFTTLSGAVNFSGTPTFGAGLTVTAGTTTTAALSSTTGTFSGDLTLSSNITNTGGIYAATATGVEVRLYPDGSNTVGAVGTVSNHGLRFLTNSVERWRVSSSGHFIAETDNTYDIGASGATRPRALYVAGTGTFGGAITVTGNSTITGTLGGVTTLSCTTVTATNLGGTLSTAAQTNVTSVGTLTALTVSGVSVLQLTGGGNKIAEATSNGDLWIGPQSAIATTATAGMLILPGCNGTPTGARGLGTSGFPLVYDYSAQKIWVNHNGTWRGVAVT